MSQSYNSSSIRSSYGLLGQNTAEKMNTAVNSQKMRLSYDPTSKKFIIIDCHTSPQQLQQVFDQYTYKGWRPNVLEKSDSLGNLTVELIAVRDDMSSSRCDPSSTGRGPMLAFEGVNEKNAKETLNSPDYGKILKDPDLLFHGINAAIWKIPKILTLGILSKKGLVA